MVRCRAASALAAIGQAAVPALVPALKGHDIDGRRWAANALRDIGPAARAAVPALIHALSDEDWAVRLAASRALQKAGWLAGPPDSRPGGGRRIQGSEASSG